MLHSVHRRCGRTLGWAISSAYSDLTCPRDHVDFDYMDAHWRLATLQQLSIDHPKKFAGALAMEEVHAVLYPGDHPGGKPTDTGGGMDTRDPGGLTAPRRTRE